MANVQIRNVPDSVLESLRNTANTRGESLQQYLLSVLSEQARIDATAAVLAEAGENARAYNNVSIDSAQAVRAARDERDQHLAAGYSE